MSNPIANENATQPRGGDDGVSDPSRRRGASSLCGERSIFRRDRATNGCFMFFLDTKPGDSEASLHVLHRPSQRKGH